ncbi:YdeI/OmpD-associated family protein [Ideonella azotifigens]|uniref:YdeI/OmpD-associated family protein n=1 Tax=Ideonella azotifigens TaxID=513160 RepID=A0ABN1JT15_9BURK|nr:YdeI/OmpD-associated family protein [Ideonella azotifigens]MCD2340989.1 YdeI/OmpD-associated family protein [Ideonella azotifigens]
MSEALYFATPAQLHAWFKRHHATQTELLLGYWKVGSGQPSVTWPESVDEALCVGWIDGVRRRIDDARYSIRFTPRRPGSVWSMVNVQRVPVLLAEGRMRPEGLAVFEARKPEHHTGYTFAARPQELPPEMAAQLHALPDALAFFLAQPPGYRRTAVHWVTSPKTAATQARRLAELLASCARGERLGHTQKYR